MGKSKAKEEKRLRTSFIPCEMKEVKKSQQMAAVGRAINENPANAPSNVTERSELVAYTGKYFGPNGADLTVYIDSPNQALKERILTHFNAYSGFCNIKFRLVNRDGQVRVTLDTDGYWSNMGTDIFIVSKNFPTMGLAKFHMGIPESEFRRVIRHEAGHTLGFPHGHLLPEIVKRIDKQKAYKWFEDMYGWSKGLVDGNVLQELNVASLIGTLKPDYESIMDYQLPDAIFIDGKGVRGGVDFTMQDMIDCSKLYPLQNPIILGKKLEVSAANGYIQWRNSRNVLMSVEPYPYVDKNNPGHKGIIYVTTNGKHIACGPGVGGGPHVKVYDVETAELVGQALCIDPNSRFGAIPVMEFGWGQVRVSLGEGAGPLYQEFDPVGMRPVGGVAIVGGPGSRTGLTFALCGHPHV